MSTPSVTPFVTTQNQEPTGIAAFGTLIQVLSNNSPESWATIEGIGDIAGPNIQIAEAETTSHSSGAPVRTFIPTLIDPGEQSFPCFWNPDDPTQSANSPYGLEYLFWTRQVTDFRLIIPNQSHRTRRYKGYVKQLGEVYPMAGIATRNTVIRITSPMQDVPTDIKLTPDAASIPAAGGPLVFEVACGGNNAMWQALSDVAWAHVTDPIGLTQGDQTVDVTVDVYPTPTAPREGHITIAALALVYTITQDITT